VAASGFSCHLNVAAPGSVLTFSICFRKDSIMSEHIAAKSRFLLGTVFAALAGISGLASCGSSSVETPSSAAPPLITVTLVAASDSVAYRDSTTLSWTSTNSSSCTSSGGGGTGKEGTFTTGALNATTTYTVTCTGANASPGSASKTITVAPPVITHFTDAGSGNVTVTSVNDLTNGAYIIISGTTHYNGTYTVANVDALNHSSFTIVHAFAGDDATGVWKPAGGMISGCTNHGATGAISLFTVPSRFHGVAPFSVFFDATATSASSTTRPFHELEYRWNFGEDPAVLAALPGGANWTYGSTKGSRNIATGPVAAHVFEAPGLYTVELSVTDGTNTVTNRCAQIAVEHPDSFFDGNKTVCVSTSGDFSDCPSGASHVTTANFVTAMGNITSTVKRILFRAGETTNWTASSAYSLTQAGPGLIGSYGTGSKPLVRVTGNSHSAILFQSNDWRAIDLAFDGIGTSSSSVTTNYGRSQITILRMDITNIDNGFGTSSTPYTDQYAVQDSTFIGLNCEDGQGCVAAWVYGERFAFQGNHIDNTRPSTGVVGGEHTLRFPKVIKGVISNNDAWNPGVGKHCLKLHSANLPTQAIWDGTYTEQVVIADNYFKAGTGVPWNVAISAQNGSYDERLRNIIVERNYLTETGSAALLSIADTVGGTIRNNIFNMGSQSVGLNVAGDSGDAPPPADLINVYNNTFYTTTTTTPTMGIRIWATPLAVTARNNLVVSTHTTPLTVFRSAGTYVADHNVVSSSPAALFVSGAPTVPADFMLNTLPSNPARDAGTTVPVWSDFFGPFSPNGTTRTQSAGFDVGADEVP
jgi:hypothetical protein